ncbi:MAG: hypothetical protein D6805_05890 [Planctomycetota bacterium]|nr:MAG: hypothetical protein D6805_05890 [Planctomycetota bacterium]
MSKNIHVIGVGTIGEPLTAALCDFKNELGIDEITFHKRSPFEHDRPRINALVKRRKAKLAVDEDVWEEFKKKGYSPSLTHKEALEMADVVIDCTPSGNQNKEKIFQYYLENTKGFIAQGSEFGFGKPYARGINDKALNPQEDHFIQVVSCNTHNIAILLDLIAYHSGEKYDNLEQANFLCMRRASDISQKGSFIPAPEVGLHDVDKFGTHHARDAYNLYQTIGVKPNIFSSALKLNTQYMHILHFNIQCKEDIQLPQLLERMRENPRVAFTTRRSISQIFSFGRDHGHYGRILNQTVIPTDCLTLKNPREITGFCFTPQDGNSLLSSIAAAMWFLYPQEYENKIQCLRDYFFEEV